MSDPKDKESRIKDRAAEAPANEVGRLIRKVYPGEVIQIGQDVEVGVLEIKGSVVRICIRAPKSVPIVFQREGAQKPREMGKLCEHKGCWRYATHDVATGYKAGPRGGVLTTHELTKGRYCDDHAAALLEAARP